METSYELEFSDYYRDEHLLKMLIKYECSEIKRNVHEYSKEIIARGTFIFSKNTISGLEEIDFVSTLPYTKLADEIGLYVIQKEAVKLFFDSEHKEEFDLTYHLITNFIQDFNKNKTSWSFLSKDVLKLTINIDVNSEEEYEFEFCVFLEDDKINKDVIITNLHMINYDEDDYDETDGEYFSLFGLLPNQDEVIDFLKKEIKLRRLFVK